MSKTQSAISEVLASSVLGGGVGAVLSGLNITEKFKNTKKEEDTGLLSLLMLIFLIIIFILSIVFLIAVYKMMPSYKVLHTIMTLFIGPIWYIPALIYYCVVNGYILVLPGGMSSTGMNIGAMNNRSRNARYL